MSGDFALYRYFDGRSRLLYAGKSGDPAQRGKSHIRSSEWMRFAVSSTIERYDSPEELAAAERKAIETDRPIFNRQYNNTPEAKDRLRTYLEEAGRPDLVPARLRKTLAVPSPVEWSAQEDLLDVMCRILTADTTDHAGIRLRALAALKGYPDLPRGTHLDQLADMAHVSRRTAYRTKREERRRRAHQALPA